MRPLSLSSSILLLSLSLAGCQEGGGGARSAREPAAPTSAKTKTAPLAEKAPAAPAAWKQNMTMDCPTNLLAVEATAADTKDGISVTMVDPQGEDAQRLRDYSRYLADASVLASEPEEALRFPGVTGNRAATCPIVMKNTTVAYEEVENGARLTITPKAGEELEALRKQVRERLSSREERRELLRSLKK